ncbi:MAG: M15 family metallopeptidase [Christensenellales bacterium]
MKQWETAGVAAAFLALLATLALLFAWSVGGFPWGRLKLVDAPVAAKADERTVKRDILALMAAYPGQIADVERDGNGRVFCVMASGAKIVYDDMQAKSFEAQLNNADLQDMMEQPYPLGRIAVLCSGDPGRIREYKFLGEVYGKSRGAIEKNLCHAALDGAGSCSFSRMNGAADALITAFDGAAALCKKEQRVYGFVYPPAGTYNYRLIAGTNRLSPHAFGIAVDLKSDSADYWRWATEEQGQGRLSDYPQELVRIFESSGFIWGGKWAHFDFLHYEYRPELILKAKADAAAAADGAGGEWYAGFEVTEEVRGYIQIIEKALKEKA